jgi:hypothetical protein
MSIDENSLRYDELLEHYKKELAHFQFVRKKEMILKLAQKLKEAGTPDHLISSILANDLRGYDVNKDYIRQVLPKELRNPYTKLDTKSEENSENADKIPIEVSITGQQTAAAKEQEDARTREEILLENKRFVELMAEQKQQFTELVQSTNLLAAGSKNKDVKDSLEYKALEAQNYEQGQRITELEQLVRAQMKEHPEQTFQTASTIQAKPENTGKLNGEAEFPAKDLSTFFLSSKNARKCMYLTIKDSIVATWQSDFQRQK